MPISFQRDNTVKAFREGRIWVLICTELMARGIDFKGINLVINYDFPPSAISYIHRIGRAGRAGRLGKALTLFTTEDTVNLRRCVYFLLSTVINNFCLEHFFLNPNGFGENSKQVSQVLMSLLTHKIMKNIYIFTVYAYIELYFYLNLS